MILRKIKRILFAVITVAFSLIAVDLVLHLAAAMSPRINELVSIVSAKIPDKRLGHRPNPIYPGHDENGFRNPRVPSAAHVVALGDSQTYGSGVTSVQAWPRVLETLTGRSVYNMGLGGYGPVHSLLLWDEAITLKPDVIIEGIYSGNDLYDSFSMIYKRGNFPELKTDDKNLLDAISQAEEFEPLNERVAKIYRRGRTRSKSYTSLKSWLSENSKVYGLLRRTQYELSRIRKSNEPPSSVEDEWQKAKSFAARYSEYAQLFSGKSSRTVFTSDYRLTALNLDDPRIREGQRVSLEAIRQMHQLAIRDGIRFIVLLIPTKELVFSEHAKGIDTPSYHTLVRYEQQFWNEAKSFLEANSIEYLDALQPLQAELEAGAQPYQVSYDGHPNEHGQSVIAGAVYSYLESKK